MWVDEGNFMMLKMGDFMHLFTNKNWAAQEQEEVGLNPYNYGYISYLL